jgi:preprotein translocase subunit SecD
MQFDDADVTSDVTQNAIAIVKKQLQTIGIANIQVRETVAGRLKITYNSDLDVASIKRIFSKELSLELGYVSLGSLEDGEQDEFPSNKSSNSYNLNVSEIQNSYDAESDFNGYVLELTPENERLYNPVVDLSIDKNDAREKNRVEKLAYLIQRNIALALNNSSRIIPEVRAGPASNSNS